MPIVSFLFMLLFLNIKTDNKQGLKFIISILFAAICWIISSALALSIS